MVLKMVGTPVDALPYLRGIQAVLAGYEGYTKGKRRTADRAIRDEIIRAARRTRAHIANIHDAAFLNSDLTMALVAKQCCTSIDALIEEVAKASSGLPNSFFSSHRAVTNGDLKRLIRHDHHAIMMVKKATNIANAAERELTQASEEGAVHGLVQRCQQMVTSATGFFSERTMLLDGLRQKKRRI